MLKSIQKQQLIFYYSFLKSKISKPVILHMVSIGMPSVSIALAVFMTPFLSLPPLYVL
jgi:hypothetical protein